MENMDDDEDWIETEDESPGTPVTCLFCPVELECVESGAVHCLRVHNLDFQALKERHSMDCYSFIKFVNYVCENKPTPNQIMACETPPWKDEKYLKPTDATMLEWITFDFLDWIESNNEGEKIESDILASNNCPDEKEILKAKILDQQAEIVELRRQMDVMRKSMQRVVEGDVDGGGDGSDGDSPKQSTNDAYYFNSYDHFSIHKEMLSDDVRTSSYKYAIVKNANYFEGKIVLDVGCGTGILSLFAASVNPSKVYAVEKSNVIFCAMDIARENGLDKSIEFIKGKVEDKESMPFNKNVDAIISEWMGYCLLFENMLDSVIFARDNYLAPGGIILPNKCGMYLCGANHSVGYNEHVAFWSNVYGYRMTCMVAEALIEATVDIVPESSVVTQHTLLRQFDLFTCQSDDVDFSAHFEWLFEKDEILNTVVGYFDAAFDCLAEKVMFSTGPQDEKTHWKQTVFYLPHILYLKAGDKLQGTFTCTRCKENKRNFVIVIKLNDDSYTYNLR